MKSQNIQTESSSGIFLTGAILLANFDYSGLADYAIKAAIGGAIWMSFKIASDLLNDKIKNFFKK